MENKTSDVAKPSTILRQLPKHSQRLLVHLARQFTGLLYPEHAQSLTALPRLSLNGDFQDIRYVKALLSGVPFAVMKGLQRFSRQQSSAA